ncbi:MAG: DUF2330 domain-containing protein [Myxococcales bacterium]|nr:DUF2330 domain-containing protein [Myxococcales bacterium]
MPSSTTKVSFAVSAACLAFALGSEPAHALGLASGEPTLSTNRLRIAVAVGPYGSTYWAELRTEGANATAALVFPAPQGASLDTSSEAWFEALEAATAPRVVTPLGQAASCGGAPNEQRVDAIGELLHEAPSPLLEVAVLADLKALEAWATAHGLAVPPALAEALGSLEPLRFVALRTVVDGSHAVTPTLRVSTPQLGNPVLPFTLTRAGSAPLAITGFVIREGGAAFAPGPVANIDLAALSFDAALGTSDYRTRRSLGLASPSHVLIESAGHDRFAVPITVTEDYVMDALIPAYFARAKAYGGAYIDADSCTANATLAMALTSPLARVCPRAELGVIEASQGCSELVLPGQAAPQLFRCTAAHDELAVALSGLVPKKAWLTRAALELGPGEAGVLASVDVTSGPTVSPVIVAAHVDSSGCTDPDEGAPSGSANSTGAGTGAGSGGIGNVIEVPVYEVQEGCGHSGPELAYLLYVPEEEAPPDYYYYEEDACSGDTSDSYEVGEQESEMGSGHGGSASDARATDIASPPLELASSDDCSGDTDESYDAGNNDCGGDTAESYDAGNDDCGGDASTGYESDSWSEAATTSDSSLTSEGCDGESTSPDSCGIASPWTVSAKLHRPRSRVRLSPILMLALAVVMPLRRRARPRSRQLAITRA